MTERTAPISRSPDCLALSVFLVAVVGFVACSPPERVPELGEIRWVVPSAVLPPGLVPLASNNNVSIALHEERLFMGWRTSETHFASEGSRIHLVSSADLGTSWDLESTWELGADVREPLLYVVAGQLFFQFFEAGTDPLAFEPLQIWRSEYLGTGSWSELEARGEEGEVPWEVVVREGVAWMTSYVGEHYDLTAGTEAIELRFSRSEDGRNWSGDTVYVGGASEAAFQWDDQGALWAILRNEDGDSSGFGSLLCTAPPGDSMAWECPDESNPERYDSPRMFTHGGEVWLLARRDVDGPYDQGREDLTFQEQRLRYLLDYSARPKRTALYRVDRELLRVEHVFDLPSAGDTAFPSVVKLGPHRFLVANYSSPVEDPDRTWLQGQLSGEGTGIYLVELSFEPTEP
jgi:hypothetical protein